MEHLRLRLHGFTLAEKLALEKALGPDNMTAMQTPTSGGRHSELGVYDVIVSLGPALIGVFGMWLSKNRRRVRTEEEVDVLHSDGTVGRKRINYDARGSEADADVVRQMTDVGNFGQVKPDTSKSSPHELGLPAGKPRAQAAKKASGGTKKTIKSITKANKATKKASKGPEKASKGPKKASKGAKKSSKGPKKVSKGITKGIHASRS